MTTTNGQAAPEVKPQEVPTLPPQVNPLGRISEIAMRLGVSPVSAGHAPSLLAMGVDGRTYDIWEVASAFLDAIERKSN